MVLPAEPSHQPLCLTLYVQFASDQYCAQVGHSLAHIPTGIGRLVSTRCLCQSLPLLFSASAWLLSHLIILFLWCWGSTQCISVSSDLGHWKGKVKMLIAHPKESRFLFLFLMLCMVYLWQWCCPKQNCFALRQFGYVTQGGPYLIRVPCLCLCLGSSGITDVYFFLFSFKVSFESRRIAPQWVPAAFAENPRGGSQTSVGVQQAPEFSRLIPRPYCVWLVPRRKAVRTFGSF